MARGWRTPRHGAIALLTLIILSQGVQAQPEQGPGGGPGGPGRFRGSFMRSGSGFGAGAKVRLAAIDEVQKALKLTGDPKKQVDDLNEEMRHASRDMWQSGGGPEGFQKINEDVAAKLN